MADGLDPVRVIRALARPGIGDELDALGVRNLTGFGEPEVYVPPEYEQEVRELVDEALGPKTETPGEGKRLQASSELDLGGQYTPAELMAGAKAYADGKRTIEAVQAAAEISYRRARRLRSWLKAGAIFYDGRTVKPGRGYQLTRIDSDYEHPAVRLVRLYPS